MRFSLYLLLLCVFVLFNSCASSAHSPAPSSSNHWGNTKRRSYPHFLKVIHEDTSLKRGRKKNKPDLRKDDGVLTKRKSSSDKLTIPAVNSKTMGEVMMASVIATAVQIIKDKKMVNNTDARNMISIIENMLPSVKKDAVLES